MNGDNFFDKIKCIIDENKNNIDKESIDKFVSILHDIKNEIPIDEINEKEKYKKFIDILNGTEEVLNNFKVKTQ